MFKKISAIISGMVMVLLFAGVSFAATSVRLEQPKSPTNKDTFDLTFVALDTDNNPITVKCYKKGPSDGGFSQFGSDIVLSNGGNTDTCPINSSVINQQGTYNFYVTANSATSSTVSVDFNTSTPGTPSNYNKAQLSSCEYKISFRTADDSGKTVKVELYRSTNTSFNADSGSKVQDMGISSNTDGSFIDYVPSCGTTYYYAIRAFDSAGNGSGVVGDSQTNVTTINPTGTVSGNSSNGGTGGGAIPVVTSSVAEGGTPTTEPTGTSPTSGEKGVLGAKTSPSDSLQSFISRYGGWAIIGFLILVGLFIYFRQRMKKSSR